MFEEFIEEIKENYEKRIEKTENMFDELIKEFTEQLNEVAEDSNEDTIKDCKLDVGDLVKSLPGKRSSLEQSTSELKVAAPSQNTELEELQSTLASVTAELEKKKEELLAYQKSVKDLDTELNLCKVEKEKLSSECINYQCNESKAIEAAKKYEVDVKDLEQHVSSLQKELSDSKELCQLKDFNFHEMKSENDVLKTEVDTLKKEMKELKDVIKGYDVDTKDYKVKIGDLEDKLLYSEKNYAAVKEQLQMKISLPSEVENENSELKKEVEAQEEQSEQLEHGIVKFDLDAENIDGGIPSLEGELLSNEIKIEEQLQANSDTVSTFQKELQVKVEGFEMEVKELNNVVMKYQTSEEEYKTTIKCLEERLCSTQMELNAVRKQIETDSARISELEREADAYKNEIIFLKQQSSEDSERYKEIMDELETEQKNHEQNISSLKKELNKASEELQKSLLHSEKLLSENNAYELEIKNLKQEKETKGTEVTEKLLLANNELKNIKDEIQQKSAKFLEQENCLAQFKELIVILEKCEAASTTKIEALHTTAAQQKSEVADLHRQIRDKEFSIEELEKALCESQEKLKDIQISCDQKLMSEKEQHGIEIEQTIKLKHLVEEENMSLKKRTLKRNSVDLKSVKKKENPPKNATTRSLWKRGQNYKELSFSSIESSTPDIKKQKARKRVSDQDFEPAPDKVTKKMKVTEASKIPVKRTTRRKLQSDKNENLSPVQKIANTITSKIRVISDNISTHISSPRMTRGRKKLFNPEAPSSSRAGRVTRERR